MSQTAFAARHSMDSDSWYTPVRFVEAARSLMGEIDLDPMSHPEANRAVKATRFFTEQDNCFRHPWHGRVFLNPAGGFVNEAWKYLAEEFTLGRTSQAVWIGYSLEQLQTLQQARAHVTPLDYPICITKKRIAFIENEAKKAARILMLLAKGEAPNASEAARKLAASIRAGKEPPNSPSHSNYITYLGPRVDEFARIFAQFGAVKR